LTGDTKESLIGVLRNPYGDIKDLPAKGTKEMAEDKLNIKIKTNIHIACVSIFERYQK
jgi:hypothetical protein